MAVATKAERSKLTPAQSKKLAGVVSTLATQLKVKKDAMANLERFADKYARFKLGVRGTGPHAHGFNAAERKAITEAIRTAFGIKVAPRKAAAPKAPAKKKSGNRRGSTKRSTAQLAREQAARAAGHPIAGTEVVRQGS